MTGNSSSDGATAAEIFNDNSGKHAVDREKSDVNVSVGDMFCDECGGRRVYHDFFETWECQQCGSKEQVGDESPTFDSVIGQEESQDKWEAMERSDDEDEWEPLDGDSGKECPECGGSNISSYQQQTGGADEGMTGFHECKDCGNNWRTGYGS